MIAKKNMQKKKRKTSKFSSIELVDFSFFQTLNEVLVLNNNTIVSSACRLQTYLLTCAQ